MKYRREKYLTCAYFALYIVTAVTLMLTQPLCDWTQLSNPPDEIVRYKVPLYICMHGTLPTGFEEELMVAEVDYTYGFYTLLPFMIQGCAMRLVHCVTDSQLALLYTARLVNVCTGLIMAYVILLLGKRLFRDARVRWIFCFLVTFLPQSLFLHTYVNTDSMCLLSTALMLYGLVRGYGDGFSIKSCLILAAGVILCTLSYYNAYGFIISSIVLFTACFFRQEKDGWKFDSAGFLKKGMMISLLVILCISWQFIRNYCLYDGDFIGLETKENFMKAGGTIRDTHSSRGEPLSAMLLHTSFLPKLVVSFISNYGSVSIYTWPVVYVFYLFLFAAGILGMIFARDQKSGGNLPRIQIVLFHANMVFCMLMPLILIIRYAYTIDYQAQGRYIMPGLVPFMYYVCRGLEKLPVWKKATQRRRNTAAGLLMAGIAASLVITVFVSALPYYLQTTVL